MVHSDLGIPTDRADADKNPVKDFEYGFHFLQV